MPKFVAKYYFVATKEQKQIAYDRLSPQCSSLISSLNDQLIFTQFDLDQSSVNGIGLQHRTRRQQFVDITNSCRVDSAEAWSYDPGWGRQ